MMSKSSFLVSLKINLRRRIWLIAVMVLCFFFILPINTAISLSSSHNMYYVDPASVSVMMGQIFGICVGMDLSRGLIIAILALYAAIQGFGYMYSKAKLDMYLSEPVGKGRRFATIYVNGFLAYIIPYVLFLLISFGVAASMGANVNYAIADALSGFVGNTLLFFAVYNLGILAVMLTGNLIVTIMASGVFMFYDIVLISLLKLHAVTFFKSYYSTATDEKWDQLLFLPFSHFVKICFQQVDYSNAWPSLKLDLAQIAGDFVYLVVFGILILFLAWFSYTRKPSEACGKAISFRVLKPIIKVFLIVPIGLGTGIIMYTLSGNTKGMLILGLVIGVVLMHGLVEVIYDFDFRSVTHGWKTLLLSAILVAVGESLFVFDLTGYDLYVPQSDQVTSASIYFTDNYDSYYEDDMISESAEEHILKTLKIKDTDSVCELAARHMGQKAPEHTRQAVFLYRMENGHEIYRRVNVDYLEDADLMEKIMAEDGYAETLSEAFNDGLFARIKNPEVYLYTGYDRVMLRDEALSTLRDAYTKDYKEFTYSHLLSEIVSYEIQVEQSPINGDGDYIYLTLPVYPSFERTKKILTEELGYEPKTDLITADQIESLTVTNYNTVEPVDGEEGFYNYEDHSVSVTYTDPDQIKEIADAFCSSDMNYWVPKTLVDSDYSVDIQIKDASSMEGRCCGLLTAKIPEYVVQETTYLGIEEGIE